MCPSAEDVLSLGPSSRPLVVVVVGSNSKRTEKLKVVADAVGPTCVCHA